MCRGHILLVILKTKNCWKFLRKRIAKTNQEGLRVEKVIKRKGNKIYVKWKHFDNYFNSWIDKQYIVLKSEYFAGPKYSGVRGKFELHVSNYATKSDLKNLTGVDTSTFSKKVGLANVKSNVDKLNIDKLKYVPTNLAI